MLENIIIFLESFLNDPYGSLFLILFLTFLILIIFKKITKILIMIVIVSFIYLAYMYFENKPAPEIPKKISQPLEENIKNAKNWSKQLIWKQSKYKDQN